MQKGFSGKQLNYIKSAYPSKSIHRIKSELGCSWEKVNNAVIALGIKQQTDDSKSWTNEDLTKLREYAKKFKVDKIAKLLGRTENAIVIKCNREGIELLKHRRAWTTEDENTLKEIWGTTSIGSICKKLSRSKYSVIVKVQRMGLGPFIESNEEIPITLFCELSGISRDRIVTFKKYGLRVREQKYSNSKRYKVVRVEDALEFMRTHQSLFDASKVSTYLFSPEPKWLKDKRSIDARSKKNIGKDSKYKRWTDDEVSYAKDMCKLGMGIERIAEGLPNRTKVAIRDMLLKEGLKPRSKVAWLEKDIEYLRSNYKIKTDNELAKDLKRTVKAVQAKRMEMGLTKRKRGQGK